MYTTTVVRLVFIYDPTNQLNAIIKSAAHAAKYANLMNFYFQLLMSFKFLHSADL